MAKGNNDIITTAKNENNGLGLFVRSLVSLDKNAANEVTAFLNDINPNQKQIQFIRLIVEQLMKNGAESEQLYETPFVDLAPTGPTAIFSTEKAGN